MGKSQRLTQPLQRGGKLLSKAAAPASVEGESRRSGVITVAPAKSNSPALSKQDCASLVSSPGTEVGHYAVAASLSAYLGEKWEKWDVDAAFSRSEQ